MRKLFTTWILFFGIATMSFLPGCAQLGLPTPTSFNEKIAAAQATVTQVRATATQLLVAGKLSSNDGANVLKTTDAAREGIVLARTLNLTNPSAAESKLTATVTVLTALQAYLAAKGK